MNQFPTLCRIPTLLDSLPCGCKESRNHTKSPPASETPASRPNLPESPQSETMTAENSAIVFDSSQFPEDACGRESLTIEGAAAVVMGGL